MSTGPTGEPSPSGRLGLVLLALLAGFGATLWAEATTRCRPEVSVYQTWNQAALDAIRRDIPAPTVHARNLFHSSAAAWDAWAAFDPDAEGVFVQASFPSDQVTSDRSQAVSYAMHRVLSHRYADAVGGEASLAQFDTTLADLCLSPDPDPGSPGALGIEIADTILAETLGDGSLEASGYVDPDYQPANPPLLVDIPGAGIVQPNRWQPLQLGTQATQNGIALTSDTQEFIGPNWGRVTPFAIEAGPDNGLPIDPGPPPLLGIDDVEFAQAASEVVEFSSLLDPSQSMELDVSPTTQGAAELGSYDAAGWDRNPVTNRPYEPNPVLHADYGRIIAEYWADGPESETPPGHWNVLAAGVGDDLEAGSALTIDGAPVDRLEWDVKIGLALNGALHDAAIAAWGTKSHYDYVRPISMIRHLGERGELAEVPGVVESITERSSRAGERHEHLAPYVGEQAVFAWSGEPLNPESQFGGVEWIRAAEWVPYQRSSFVTPAFAGYVSGHSTFSRAAAEVLTELTGSPFFPGGIEEHTFRPGGLLHEFGPSETVTLQWATYQDASDQSGISRLYGGIHVPADDLAGRQIGFEVGHQAVDRARDHFGS